MNLEDLIKLAGVTKSPYDTPVQEQPTEIEEQPVMDDNEGMRALIALVTPEQLNQLQWPQQSIDMVPLPQVRPSSQP